MSFIVPGFYKPQSCEQWKNRRFIRCWFLDDNDSCRLQKGSSKLSMQEQYAGCPVIRIKRNHGEIVDVEKGDRYLDAEADEWHGWGI